jgi:membrane protease YdiL (CAAX protease family)
MQWLVSALDIRAIFKVDEVKPTTILLLSALVLTLHRYFGSMEFASDVLSLPSSELASMYMFTSAFVLLGVVPYLIVTSVFRDAPASYGLRIGEWRLGVRLVGMLFPLIAVLLLYPASQTREMIDFYPFARDAGDSVAGFSVFQVARGLFFYTAWEFFFRGFMLFGLRRHVGDWLAVCIQTIPQCLWHIGMPTGEILSSIAGGILFGMMALRTGSILWPLLLHWLIGVGLDAMIVLSH